MTWEVTDGGTDAATIFNQFNIENPAALDQNYVFHLLISRQSAFASLDPTNCETQNNFLDQVISSIPMSPLQNNPLINNPGTKGDALSPGTKGGVITNATYAVAPSETSGARIAAAAPQPPGGVGGDIRDSYKDVVFVTLRAFQLAPDSAIPDNLEFRPEVNPPAITLTSLIKTHDRQQGDCRSPFRVLRAGPRDRAGHSGGFADLGASGRTGHVPRRWLDAAKPGQRGREYLRRDVHAWLLSVDGRRRDRGDRHALGFETTSAPFAAGATRTFPDQPLALTIPVTVPPGRYALAFWSTGRAR